MKENIERIRGFGLMALHGSIAVFSLLLIFAGLMVGPKLENTGFWTLAALSLVGAVSVYVNVQSSLRLARIIRAHQKLPAPDLPAFGIALALILIATQIFT